MVSALPEYDLHRNALVCLGQQLCRNCGMQLPYKTDRAFIFVADVVGVSQESIGSGVGADPLVFPDEKRNVITDFLVVDVSLDLGAGFTILALALPVEEVGVDRVVLVHGGGGEILL